MQANAGKRPVALIVEQEPDRSPIRNLVLVVDDDPTMLRSIGRLLRQFGYASLLFPSAEAFANQSDCDAAVCVLLDINLGRAMGQASS